MFRLSFLILPVLCLGCFKRAPSSYELDKRAGQPLPPAEPQYETKKSLRKQRFEEPLRTTSTIAPAARMPARTAPVIRRVWVADQTLPDGSWLQGTWWYVEVEPSHWLHEVDPGAAPFVEPAPPLTRKQQRQQRKDEKRRHREQAAGEAR
jgi:hypothetical protein